MQSGIESNIIVIKLSDGESIFSSIEHAAEVHNINSGIILGGLGMLKEFELGYYNPDGYKTRNFSEPHELVSMFGSIAYTMDDDPRFLPHVHCTVADRDHRVWGGHLHKGRVNVVNEITISRLEKLTLTRIKNENTGLMELNIKDF